MLFFWILLYGLLYSAAEAATPMAGNWPWLTPLAMLGYILILLSRVVYTKQRKNMGLTRVHLSAKTDCFYLIPLLILPLLNLSGRTFWNPPHYILLMFSVCFAEELLFRGYLLSVLVRCHGKWGIFLSSLVFSLLHCVNLLSGTSLTYVLAQMLLAFFIGVYYSLIRIYFKSLYPCIAAHFLTNITAYSSSTIPGHYLLLTAVLGCFGSVLFSKISSDLEDIS